MKVPLPGDNALGIVLPDFIREIVDQWRKDYDPFYEIFPPHITLIYPPFVSPPEWERRKIRLKNSLRHFVPFKVTLKSIGHFESGQSWVLWLSPEDNGDLILLHKLVVNQFWDYVSIMPFDYVPHITIGRFEKNQDFHNAASRVLSELTPLVFDIDKIDYLIFDENWNFRVEDHINIGP